MKKIILAFCLVACSINSFSQYTDTLIKLQKEEMLSEAKKKRNTGVILLSVGCASALAGVIVWTTAYLNPVYNEEKDSFTFSNEGTGIALFFGGGALNLISIPFWKKSNQLRREVKKAYISVGPSFVPSAMLAGKVAPVPQASFSLRFPVGQ